MGFAWCLMDIDLLWIPGGWNIIRSNIIIIFMAKAGSGGYSFFELPTKPQTILLFLVLLLLVVTVPVLYGRPCAELSKTSMAVSSAAAAARHVLLSAQQSSSSVEFDPNYKQAAKNKNITKKHFEASAHEVPSGPNPDSNK